MSGYRTSLLLLVTIIGASGCQQFSRDDEVLLAQHGGLYVPSGEGPATHQAPVHSVFFDSPNRVLDDMEFARVFPALLHMDPHHLLLRGGHAIGDRSVGRLNQLRSLRLLDASGTNLSLDGLRKLRPGVLRQLYISPEKFTDDDARELRKVLAPAKVTRHRT